MGTGIRPDVPRVAPAADHPIDAFVRARLAGAGLAPAPPADRVTLIRRLSFDLVGLPPEPDEIDEFVADPATDAYERLVDRLLASPRHGERWGRHWLDAVRYTESQGFEFDHPRPNAWHYRDYVIESLNADLPYDRFMREQIAGDVIEPVTTAGIVATSMLVCGAWDQAGSGQSNATQRALTREEEMEDLVSVVGQTFLGLTLNCARCHAHKFDPVAQEEYFQIRAVFDGVRHGERAASAALDDHARADRIAGLESALAAARSDAARLATDTTPRGRGERAAALAAAERLERAIAFTRSPPVSYVGTRQQPPPARLLARGDVTAPGAVVVPRGLAAIATLPPDLGLAADAPEGARRLAFAAWLADPRNPLPARVIVNRVWQLHFGRGIVATPNDFGASGAAPTHPELLDWLAAEFVARGWSLKSLHRLIVTSATYRQSSAAAPDGLAADAENTLLWRFAPRRLEAEAVRDAMLAVSGRLDLRTGGPSFRPFTTSSYGATFYHLSDRDDPAWNRRTVYRMNINSGKEPLLDALDCPDPSVKTPRRGVTITPLQSLSLMNAPFVQRQAAGLAARARSLAGDDPGAGVVAAYRIALGRPATPAEVARALGDGRDLERVAWALLNATEFVHVR